MADINYSYSLGTQPSNTAEPETLWSCHGVEIIPISANAVVLFNPKNDTRLLVQPEVARALEQCSQFNSLNEHLNHLFDVMPPLREQPDNALQTLELARDAGIFESADEAWQRLTASTDITPPLENGPARLFILTCDRPEALLRLLGALQDQVLPQQIEALFIIDDSRHGDSAASNAHIIQSAQTGMNIPIHHVDMNARTALISYLKANLQEADRDSIDFLLARSYWGAAPTYGLARNLALLLSVNYRALVMDDDILPQALAPPLPKKDLTFGTPDAREAVFYTSMADMQQHTLAADFSPLTAMLQSLAQPLSQLLNTKLSGVSALKGLDGRLTTSFEGASRVHLSQCGTWGDSGSADAASIFFLDSPSIQRLLQLGESLETTLSARAGWMGYRGNTIGTYGVMSGITGINHHALLPPYLPAGRGEDLLFGVMLQRLHPESAVFNEGWAVPHLPIEDRANRNQLTPLGVSASITSLTDWLGRPPRDEIGISPETRLAMLADEISRLSEMSLEALESI
ncbi:MAG: hypothetical protein P8M13_04230, partial [Luminiphilus sp.]|nr:hypothetical protein [Luminiphilus sp.]